MVLKILYWRLVGSPRFANQGPTGLNAVHSVKSGMILKISHCMGFGRNQGTICIAQSQQDIIDTDKKGRWNKLPKLDLSADLRKDLSKMMPGYRSNLHRHEWFKHGTCMGSGASPQKYYELSIAMLNAINKSPLRDLLADNIGRELTSTQISTAMERSFGKGSGKRIGIGCKRDGRRNLITEVKISVSHERLPMEVSFDPKLVQSAPTLPIGCKRGIIDPVGLQ